MATQPNTTPAHRSPAELEFMAIATELGLIEARALLDRARMLATHAMEDVLRSPAGGQP